MSNKILLVFEGERTESLIANSLITSLIEKTSNLIEAVYKTHIYNLYTEVINDPFLDIFHVIKEKNPHLQSFERDEFSQIYLFFDYDGHVGGALDQKIEVLLEYFNEESENGKIFISYPMVEAIRCIQDLENLDSFLKATFRKSDFKNFKSFVHSYGIQQLQNYSNYSQEIKEKLITFHCKKANYLVNENFNYPTEPIDQTEIFRSQQEKFIYVTDEVTILGSFPLMLLDYFGYETLVKLVSND
ncbi:hypothetical protein ACQP6U_08645 [Acinetobacter baumannii]|uniref:hypothetical protein n=1 Tax=Acinetobacter baumannii TaxID=470 RepID=UPI002653DD70|nr:hypothetical protein [Acinetobacter baumannii]